MKGQPTSCQSDLSASHERSWPVSPYEEFSRCTLWDKPRHINPDRLHVLRNIVTDAVTISIIHENLRVLLHGMMSHKFTEILMKV